MEDIKADLKQIVHKILVTIQSRKFWTCLMGVVLIANQMATKTVDPTVGLAGICSLIISYAGLTDYEDTHSSS